MNKFDGVYFLFVKYTINYKGPLMTKTGMTCGSQLSPPM